MTDVFNMLIDMFGKLFGLLDTLFTEFNFYPILFGAFFCISAYRFLLMPILGKGMGSDTAKKRKNDDG